MVPLRALRVAAAIAHFDDDEAVLCERRAGPAGIEGLGHALGLRPGIDVGDDRILLRRIEVERLVHHAVDIRDAIVRLDRERLGELEAGFLQRRQVRRLELRDDVAQRVDEHRLRRRVHARVVVHEIPRVVRHRHRVRGVAGVQQLHAGAVVTDAIEVRIVGILALLAADGRQVEGLRSVVHAVDRHRDELPLGHAVLQRAGVRVIEVVVAPAVALGPEQQVGAAVHQPQRPRLDVGIRALFDDGAHFSRPGIGDTDVEPLLVATEAREVDLVGRGTQPLRGCGRASATLTTAAALAPLALAAAEPARVFALPLGGRRGGNRQPLVLEAAVLDAHLFPAGDVEDEHLLLRDVLFAGHGVAVGLQRRPRIGERVDDPEVLDLAVVAANQRETPGIGRPDNGDGRHPGVLVGGRGAVLLRLVLLILVLLLLLLLLLQDLLVLLLATRVAVELFAVRGQLRLDDRRIVRRLLHLLVVGGIHHVEIVVAREEDGLLVGRHRHPARPGRRRDVVFVEGQLAGRHLVLEPQGAVAGRRACRGPGAGAASLLRDLTRAGRIVPAAGRRRGRDLLLRRHHVGIAGDLHLEFEDRIVLGELEIRERQVLRVVGLARDRRQRRGHLRGVEERRFGLLQRIDDVEAAPLARLVGVPEAIAGLHPARRHAGVEQHLADLARRPARGEVEVGRHRRRRRCRRGLRGGTRRGRQEHHGGAQDEGEPPPSAGELH